MSGCFNGEGSSGQIGSEPEQSCARDAEPREKSLEENVMIYSVKCSKDVEEAQTRDLLMADGRYQFVTQSFTNVRSSTAQKYTRLLQKLNERFCKYKQRQYFTDDKVLFIVGD